MKFRCPKCGEIFSEKVPTCPKCGNVLKYKKEEPAPVDKKEPAKKTEPLPKEATASQIGGFNVMNLLVSLLALGFHLYVIFGLNYFYSYVYEGDYYRISISNFDVVMETAYAIFQLIMARDFLGALTYAGADVFTISLLFTCGIAAIVQLFVVFANFGRLFSGKLPAYIKEKEKGRGQIGAATTGLGFAYLVVFFPYVVALIVINVDFGDQQVLRNALGNFVQLSRYYGLTYFHAIIIGVYVLMVIFAIVRQAIRRNIEKELGL